MSKLRRNPFTGEWSIYAPNRQNRPNEFEQYTTPITDDKANCPFCMGNESKTTKTLYQDKDGSDWQVRVFENKFPALSPHIALAEDTDNEPFYTNMLGEGVHEVLVDTPIHTKTIDTFTKDELRNVLVVLQKRYKEILSMPQVQCVEIFKNYGASAGMSIRHSHWQLIGLPMLPERNRVMTKHMHKGECLMCKILEYERQKGIRIVAETETFVALTPYAARFAYEICIVPKAHVAHYCSFTESQLAEISLLLENILPKVVALAPNIGFNICFMDGEKNNDFHWHLQILPRIGGFAGLEFATSSYILTVTPEQAAEYFRTDIEK